jgi:DNA-binding CsgD family transcriptional regulator
MLNGRAAEQAAIDRLLAAARAGTSGVLVLRGDAGIGKTALLDYAAARAGGVQVVRGTGIESEAELPFAGLHLLLRPALDRIGELPVPQRQALEGAFGLVPGRPGDREGLAESSPRGGTDRLLIGMAVLSLLSELAGEGPLLCLVDDAHWLDGSSAAALAFAARRLGEDGIALIMAARDGEGRFSAQGLPELRLAGLPPESAAALLDAQPADLTAALRYRILAEAQGNPLALIELPAATTPQPPLTALTSPSTGFPRHDSPSADSLHGRTVAEDPAELALTGRLLAAFSGHAARLPDASRLLLLVAAADDVGEASLVLRAGKALGADAADLAPAERAGLIRQAGQSLAFRHPLIRAAVYQEAPLGQRLAVHRALADAMEGREGSDDAGRRAWHRAAGAAEPDEQIAAGLDQAAEQAAQRGGYAAAAAASARAAELSADPAARARRLTVAAEAAAESGDLTRARALAARAEPDAGDAMLRAGLLHVRALADFGEGSFRGAHRLLLEGADLLAGTSPALAARILVQAFHTAWYIGEPELADVAGRLTALRIPDGEPMQPVASYLAATLGTLFGWRADGVPALTDVIARARRAGADAPLDLVQVCGAGLIAGQDALTYETAAALAAEARGQGRIGLLPTILFFLAEGELFHGRHRDALATAAEAVQVASDSGQWHWVSQVSGLLAYLAAAAGDEPRCRKLADEAMTAATAGNVAPGSAWGNWSLGLLDLGGGRVEAALGRLETLAEGPTQHHVSVMRSAPDLVEAAVRIGEPDRAARPLRRFEQWGARAGQPWIDALVLRCRALLAPDAEAERLYAAALEAHQREDRPFERARTQSLYGEWLRRARRKTDARTQLRAALEIFDRLGAEPWSSRAASELRATGVVMPQSPGRHGPGALGQLTPQELQIVRLAAQGLSNRDIAAQLFLSPRTVGYHLYKAYPKLGVAARSELPDLLYNDP